MKSQNKNVRLYDSVDALAKCLKDEGYTIKKQNSEKNTMEVHGLVNSGGFVSVCRENSGKWVFTLIGIALSELKKSEIFGAAAWIKEHRNFFPVSMVTNSRGICLRKTVDGYEEKRFTKVPNIIRDLDDARPTLCEGIRINVKANPEYSEFEYKY